MKPALLCVPFCALLLGLAPQEQPLSFADAFESFAGMVEAGEPAEAVAFAEPWLEQRAGDATGDDETSDDETGSGESVVVREPLDEHQRAALRYGLGLVRGRGEDHAVWPTAVDDFQAARALAGPGALRLDASYDAGVVELQEGERLRAQLPEVAGGVATPQVLQAPGAPPAAATAEDEDPLPLARAAYERARTILSERLRADWQDVDTRANLELIQRRLRELDDIERRREEQEQQQQQQEQQQQDPSEDQQDQENQDQEQQDGENQDGERQPSQEDAQGEESQQEEEQEPQEGEDQPQGEDEAQPQELEGQEGGQEAQDSQLQDDERHLTREEVMRLLDRLAELEEQGRQVEAALRKGRRTPVERDW